MNVSRILVIDDNTSMRAAVCDILEQAGHETVSASNGQHAAQIHHQAPVDLVITDLFMPETDGLEVISQFRRDFPDVKIIAVSGGGSRGLIELLSVAKKMGAQRTFIKPFTSEDLLLAVDELLTAPNRPSH